MNIKNILLHELQEETAVIQKFLESYPEELNDYKPHEKSMSMQALTNHIVEIIGWPEYILETEKLDFATGDYQPSAMKTRAEFLAAAKDLLEKSEKALNATTDEILEHQRWKITAGDQIFSDWSKYGAIRHALSQITHHRAQLGVYYRLNNIPVPGSYGPSADEQG